MEPFACSAVARRLKHTCAWCREEKNYLKLMSKKIQAARSTVPKAFGSRKNQHPDHGGVSEQHVMPSTCSLYTPCSKKLFATFADRAENTPPANHSDKALLQPERLLALHR